MAARGALEGALAGEGFAQHEGVDFVGAFVGEDTFEVEHVADDGVLEQDAVGAE